MPLVNVVQRLSLARDLGTVQEIVRQAARSLIGADGATFVLRDKTQCYYADEDAIEPLWKGMRFPLESCISGWSMLHREPAVIPDVYADSRIPTDVYRATFVKSLAMAPIRSLDPIGAIGVYWGQSHQATEAEVRLLQALADTTAVASRCWCDTEPTGCCPLGLQRRTCRRSRAERELWCRDLARVLRRSSRYVHQAGGRSHVPRQTGESDPHLSAGRDVVRGRIRGLMPGAC